MRHRHSVLFVVLVWLSLLNIEAPCQPPYDLRALAEFEPQEGVIIGWYDLGSYGARADTMWARAVEAIQDVATAYIGIRYSSSVGSINSFLTSLGIPLDNVEYIVTGTIFSVWVRDYGPEFLYKEDGARVIVEGGYAEEFPQYLANLWGLEHYHAPISMQGGNYMSDGAREIAVSGAHVTNPGLWQQTIRRYFDLPLHIVPELVGEMCGHIDMYARFVAPNKVIVSQYASPYHNHNMDLAAEQFEDLGYEVYRVPTPPVVTLRIPRDAIDNPSLLHLPPGAKPPSGDTRSVYRTYTNGIQCNGKYLLPVYNHSYDAQAGEVFQSALPDHEIIPINCNQIIQYGGALHCTSSDVQTAGLPRPEPLTVVAVGTDAILSWPTVASAASYELFRRTAPCGYEAGLGDVIGATSDVTWTDVGAFGQPGTLAYQVIAVDDVGARSVMSPRVGGSRFDMPVQDAK